ncbi:MAG: aminotransferase class III-fold pyridoxal phosphate-dependent enzyme, partial [Porphyromonadaceae bacterium]|nr:aminotransferase class III-fold pyridoxal phosphate-dependent enzyme [Porphyromonadaceae bacterium]
LTENAAQVGSWLLTELKKLPGIKEVRGRGLMIGIEFDRSAKELRQSLLYDYKVFTGAAGTNIIRLLPPLCLTHDDAAEFMIRFKGALSNQHIQ